MDMTAATALSATAMLELFRRQALRPSQLLAAQLERIAALNPAVNALAAMDAETAMAEALASDRRWQDGSPRGPLDGLALGVKDLQDTRGLLTTHGSPRARSNVPANDLPMVARLREAGAIVLAKTNVPELGAGGNTRNPVWGATGNPFDPTLTVGGSSGGSAAALALDLLPLCTGSDTGGSLRLPAAMCGIVGYRPSTDVIAHPTRPLGWSGISVLGPMARNMDDLVLMLRACHGPDLADPLTALPTPDRFDRLDPLRAEGLRLGFSEDFGGAPVDPEIRAVFRDRLARLAPQVAELHPVDLNLGEMDRVFDILRAESFLAAFGAAIARGDEGFGAHIHANVTLGQRFTLADRAWAHAEQTRILRTFHARMQGLDAILLPTTPVSPFPWTQAYPERIDGTAMDIYYRWLALTYRGSLSGGPALTLPCGRDRQGMPFGLQLLGPLRGDASLLAVGRTLESLLQADPETARPQADTARLRDNRVDLTGIVTHPPVLGRAPHAMSGPSAPRTAV